jgi:hypothetical protein
MWLRQVPLPELWITLDMCQTPSVCARMRSETACAGTHVRGSGLVFPCVVFARTGTRVCPVCYPEIPRGSFPTSPNEVLVAINAERPTVSGVQSCHDSTRPLPEICYAQAHGRLELIRLREAANRSGAVRRSDHRKEATQERCCNLRSIPGVATSAPSGPVAIFFRCLDRPAPVNIERHRPRDPAISFADNELRR